VRSTRALGALASGHRAEYTGPVVAITGSNGKTTTKEMCAAIFSVAAPCLKNQGNLNNEFGLPLTLLQRDAVHRSVVVELGMNHRGEIANLAAIARPTVSVITNIGTAHIEFLGSREAIALEKGDLVAQLDVNGVAVLNADDPLALEQGERTRARRLGFGCRADADVHPENVRIRAGTGSSFELCTPEGRIDVEVAGLGETTILNALAASAAALAAGAPLADVPTGLARYQPVAGRLETLALPEGGVLINDSYNANPQSMEIALRILADTESAGYRAAGVIGNGVQRIAVLGDMGELGAMGSEAHRQTGRLTARLGIDQLFALGELAEQTGGKWASRCARAWRDATACSSRDRVPCAWSASCNSSCRRTQIRPPARKSAHGANAECSTTCSTHSRPKSADSTSFATSPSARARPP
jgi:UDP-N-acetylmuramoyl-tripeptide--D-alanyl-D-alanine ligase